MMPDKWKNGITAIIALFTQSQNDFLMKHVCTRIFLYDFILALFFLARKRTFNRAKYSNNPA
jgi:hypothetical protein